MSLRNKVKVRSNLTHSETLMLAPLLDIIFLVLVFFLVNVNYKGIQSFDMVIPKASKPDIKTPNSQIIIQLDNTILRINNQDVSLDDFIGILQNEFRRTRSTSVLVLGSEQMPYKDLIELFDLIKKSGGSNISLGVDKK